MNQLELKIEQLQEESCLTMQNAEEGYKQLKEFHEKEKERLLQRLSQERERNRKQYDQLCDQFEEKNREEYDNYEAEITAKQNEINSIHEYYRDQMSNLQYQRTLVDDQLKTARLEAKEAKEIIDNLCSEHNSVIQKLENQMRDERRQLASHTDKLISKLSAKEREMKVAEDALNDLKVTVEHKDLEIEETRINNEKALSDLNYSLDDMKEHYENAITKHLSDKNDLIHKSALLEQNIEFQAQKNTELNDSMLQLERKFKETIETVRIKYDTEVSERIYFLNKENTKLNSTLQGKHQEIKLTRRSSLKRITSLEQENSVLKEKVASLEHSHVSKESELIKELSDLKALLQQQAAPKPNSSSVLLENEKLKRTLKNLQRAHEETTTSFSNERALWEAKLQYLTQQHNRAKSNYADAQDRFNNSLLLVSQKPLSKDQLENYISSLTSTIELRHVQQLKSLKQLHCAAVQELTSTLENQSTAHKAALKLEQDSRVLERDSLTRKIQEKEKQFAVEFELLKRDRDAKLSEIKESLLYEKEELKARLLDSENRNSALDIARTQLFFSHEKERAKWELDRNLLLSQKTELLDQLEWTQRKTLRLSRDYERLRGQRRRSSRNLNSSDQIISPALSLGFNEEFNKHSASTAASPRVRRFLSPRN